MVREVSSVTVTLVVMLSVSKEALAPAPSAMKPLSQLAALLQLPDAFETQSLSTLVGAAGRGPRAAVDERAGTDVLTPTHKEKAGQRASEASARSQREGLSGADGSASSRQKSRQ